MKNVILEVKELTHRYDESHGALGRRRERAAITAVNFQIHEGEVLGIVGESGSGKSTLARTIAQEPRASSGSVRFLGRELTQLRKRHLREARTGLQMIFQDPYASLDPLWSVQQIIEEPLIGTRCHVARSTRVKKIDWALECVMLDPQEFRDLKPREMSGGQCQRVAIARALISAPRLLICDEAVSSLDAITQRQILDLLRKMRMDESGLSMLFISHDLDAVEQVCDRIAVMHQGEICEISSTDKIMGNPQHPRTIELLSAAATYSLQD